MSKDLSKQLDEIFSAAAAKKIKEAERVRLATEKRLADYRRFVKFVREVAEPAMEEVEAALVAKGVECEVKESNLSGVIEDTSKASISFRIFPNGRYGTFPHYTILHHSEGTVATQHSTIVAGRGGSSGSGPLLPIEDVSQESIKSSILEVIRAVFS